LSCAIVCVFCTCESICAQPPATEDPSPSGDLIRESDLKWRLEDADGNLVPVPAFTLELFQELLELQSRIKAEPAALPKVIFTEPIQLDGRVDLENRFARMRVTYRIKLPSHADHEEETWTEIPLRLDNSFLDIRAIEHEQEGEIYVTRDGASYVCWLRAAPNSTHTIHVPIKVPVQRTGTQDSLILKLPNMATTMRLAVAQEMVEAFSPSERSNVSWEAEGGATTITVESSGGELDLAWQPLGKVLPHALEATCATTVHVHGNHIWSEAQLKVRSRAEPIDSFIVRLPDGMDLTSHSDADFQVSELPSAGNSGSQQVLVKRLGGLTRGLIEVNLEAALPPITTETKRRTVQLGGFSVEDAVREWGSVDVMLDGSWSTTWIVGQFVQRVAVLEDPTRQQPVAARFLYDRQPYSLRLELRPKQTRGSLDTTYVVDVSDDSLQLDARIAFSTNGAAVDSLNFKMAGWTIDTVTPPESLARPFTFDEEAGILTLPIATDAAEVDFQVRARRPIETGIPDVSFDLPRPSDAALIPNATLIVLASDNVELTPELASMKWLTQETRTPALELPKRFAPPLLFREELSTESNEAAHFVARRRIRPRETTVAIASDAALDGDMVQVRQSFLVTVAYAPLAELTIAIPTSVAESGTLRITSGEQELSYREVASTETAPDADSPEPVDQLATQITAGVVSLRVPVTGEVQVDIAFEIPRKDAISAAGLRIPLVQPAGGEATANVTNTLTVRSDENTAITLADELWTMHSDDASTPNGKQEMRVRATGVMEAALVRTSAVENRSSGSTQISRVWIQSWLTPADRRDRVCFQLLSDQPHVHIQLPATAQSEELQVLVEGERPIELVNHGDLSLTITLADEQVGRVVGLEMWYFCENSRDSQVEVAIPSIIDADRAELVYWQIVMPRAEHLAWIPETLTSELVWQRDQLYWGRRGRLEQEALEGLVGASTRVPVSPDTNRYLFSSTGSVESVGFVKVSRLMLMMVSSGLALAVVLPFIYLPMLRQPAVFVVAGVILLAGSVTYPEPSVLLGQAGAIGLGLAMVACALQRLVVRSPLTPVNRRGSVYLTPDSQTSVAPSRVIEGSSRTTTATAPAHLQVAQVEGEP
jgi:hypothetical protein